MLAKLSRANLSDANLSRANLSRANLSRANLNYAHLRDANFSGVSIGWTILGDLDLSEAASLDFAIHHSPSTIGRRHPDQISRQDPRGVPPRLRPGALGGSVGRLL